MGRPESVESPVAGTPFADLGGAAIASRRAKRCLGWLQREAADIESEGAGQRPNLPENWRTQNVVERSDAAADHRRRGGRKRLALGQRRPRSG